MKRESERKGEQIALGVATGWVILRHRSYRRNLLFGSTLVTLVAVFIGAVPLNEVLSVHPLWFALFWLGCFLMVGFVLLLAVYDLISIRKEHRHRLISLEKEMAAAADEARELAKEEGRSAETGDTDAK